MIELKKNNIHKIVETDEQAKRLIEKGFMLVDTSNADNTNYKKLNIKELRKMAKEKGLANYSKLNKEELIDLLNK